MELRPIRLPDDFTELGGMICDTFQYPENPDWSVQTDEKEQIGHAVRSFKKLWPLFKILSVFSPSMKDIFRGYVAIEDGKIVGVTILQRRGTTSSWVVGTVGVLPDYRRRGLARSMYFRILSKEPLRGFLATGDLMVQPGAGVGPIAMGRNSRYFEDFGRLLDGHSAEVAECYQLRFGGIMPLARERLLIRILFSWSVPTCWAGVAGALARARSIRPRESHTGSGSL